MIMRYSFFQQFFPLVVTLSVVCGLIYWAVQQDLRMGANDPQIQMVEDTVVLLNSGKTYAASRKIAIDKSLSPFIIIYDKKGNPIDSEALLSEKMPQLPLGVFSDAQNLGEDRLTWQPANGVRIAAVVAPFKNGFVLAGRNLREVEKREDQLFGEVVVSWFIGIIAIAISIFCVDILRERK